MVIVTVVTTRHNELVLSAEGFTHRVGPSWAPVVRDVRFDDVESMTLVDVGADDLGSRKVVLEVTHRDGTVESIPRSTLLTFGMKTILGWAMKRGVEVQFEDGA